jgi:hypothetical protein
MKFYLRIFNGCVLSHPLQGILMFCEVVFVFLPSAWFLLNIYLGNKFIWHHKVTLDHLEPSNNTVNKKTECLSIRKQNALPL